MAGRTERAAVDRVHGDEVDLHGQAAEEVRDALRVFRRVVLTDDERVLDRDSTPLRERVRPERPHQFGERVFAIDGHEPRTRLVVGGMQRDGQPDLSVEVLAEALDLRDEAARRDRDAPRGEADAVGVREEPERPRRRVVVVQRLAHSHEHDAAERLALLQARCVRGALEPRFRPRPCCA